MVNDIQSHLDTKHHEQTYPPKNVTQIIVFDENQLHDVHIAGLLKLVSSGDLGFSSLKTSMYKWP